MRILNRILFTLLFVLYGFVAIHAQNSLVYKDSVYLYTAISKSNIKTYNWLVNGVLDASKTNSIKVKWTGALNSIAALSVNAENAFGCMGDNLTKTYLIVDKFPYTISIIESTNTVPKTNTNPTGGNSASFKVAISGTTVAPTDSFTIWYSIDNVPQLPVSFAKGQAEGTVLLNNRDYENYTTGDITKKISIAYVEISSKDKLNFPVASMPSAVFKVYQSPKLRSID
jgi:hypothetical protein